jgi:hypothetical protein
MQMGEKYSNDLKETGVKACGSGQGPMVDLANTVIQVHVS